MSRNEPFANLIHWLARQLPARQAVREAEWLAELESLSTRTAKLWFVIGCVLATWQLQKHPLQAGLKWSAAVWHWAKRRLWVSEGELTAYERLSNRTFNPVKRDYVYGPYAEFLASEERLPPEVELPPMNFSVSDNK